MNTVKIQKRAWQIVWTCRDLRTKEVQVRTPLPASPPVAIQGMAEGVAG